MNGDNTPLLLRNAAILAFPDGSIKASSLRRLAAKGELEIERIAGKDYVTLAAIQEMRQRAVVPRVKAETSSKPLISIMSGATIPYVTPQSVLDTVAQQRAKLKEQAAERHEARIMSASHHRR